MRLNTLKYNLDSLLEAGMIRVRHVKWSQKGREIKIYEASKKSNCFSARKREPGNSYFVVKSWRDSRKIWRKRKS
ncbi:hypothetical protein [Methanosarcina barkeri]|uniref:hypothetical protein n=1 Tax=Methanosarcina barkeri TaxID=2208 RepID=UPI000ABEC615|nr:hypothetical protein [Methanosarcina barkeri]